MSSIGNSSTMIEPKTQVAHTNDYSILSKYSLIQCGYVKDDPYLKNFIVFNQSSSSTSRLRNDDHRPLDNQQQSSKTKTKKQKQNSCITKRSPIINRGYYVRHLAMRHGLQLILDGSLTPTTSQSPKCAKNKTVFVSLGAGFDTTSLRLQHQPSVFFLELDYPTVVQRKADIIVRNKLRYDDPVLDYYHDTTTTGTANILALATKRYLLFGVDLRQPQQLCATIAASSIAMDQLRHFIITNDDGDQLDSTITTINIVLLNECSLCYLEQADADHLCRTLIDWFESTHWFIDSNYDHQLKSSQFLQFFYLGYEMLRSTEYCDNDAFGEFLRNHFSTLGADIFTFLTEQQIRERFSTRTISGFDTVLYECNMKNFWRQQLDQTKNCTDDDQNENENVQRTIREMDYVDPFDEWEELDLVCASYQLTIASRLQVSSSSFQSNISTMIAKDDNTQNNDIIIDTISPGSIISTTVYPSHHWLSVFGHASHYDAKQAVIRIFGGFGIEPNGDGDTSGYNQRSQGHRRFANIIELQLGDTSDNDNTRSMITSIRVIKPSTGLNRVHTGVVSLLGATNRYLLTGGRRSPGMCLSQFDMLIDINNNNDHKATIQTPSLSSSSSMITPTYRHVLEHFGSVTGKVIHFGGRYPPPYPNTTTTAINTISNGSIYHLYDIPTGTWSSSSSGLQNTQIHSCGHTCYGNYSILYSGGLRITDHQFVCDSTMNLFDSRTSVVNRYVLNGDDYLTNNNNNITQRYSHQLKMIENNDNYLLSIGGIGSGNGSGNLDATLIDLRTMSIIRRYPLQLDWFGSNCNNNITTVPSISKMSSIAATSTSTSSSSSPPSLKPWMLLQNFTSEIITNHQQKLHQNVIRLAVIGGGGNCFSFGTHFNPLVFYDLCL